jgi:sugar phosphate permease
LESIVSAQGGAGEWASTIGSEPPVGDRATHVRYYVLALSFLMAFMMYMERGAIGVAAPAIMREFQISKIRMGWSVSAFNWSYALFQVPGGWMADRFGPRIVLAGAMAWWSLFTAATGFSAGAISLGITRFLFGMGEAAGFPAGSRALVPWLPVRRRAFGQGFQHSGSRLGAAAAPLLVVYLLRIAGWRSVFWIFGAAGILWALAWYLYYRNVPQEHAGTNRLELELLAANRSKTQPKRAVPWRHILRTRDLWYLSAAYFCYGWVVWLYLAWFPTYLREARHFTELKSGLASLPLLAATLTNVGGGLLSDRLVSKWNNLRRGRLAVSLFGFVIAGLALVPGVLTNNALLALACLTIALAGLELTVAVSWAMCIDIGGNFSGSVSSVMNTWGNLGGAISAVMVGYLATLLGWKSPFILASAFCLFSALLVSRIDPRRSAVGESL